MYIHPNVHDLYLLDESQCKEVAPPVEPEKNDNTTGIRFHFKSQITQFANFVF